jgi:glycosyltransferase involved in cell wall biosynthesis
MRLSLFTPTNNPRYLQPAYDSIRNQCHEDWEWVVLLNGGALREPTPLLSDSRVRFVRHDDAAESRIGALKLAACRACRGGAFVEFDHDDLLVPGVLGRLDETFAAGAGFAYSDAAVFEDDYKSWGYGADHGWETDTIYVYGRRYTATKCFPPTARSLCEVYYAPDHVRAWSRDAYFTAGGHDPAMAVGDDHDLVCRTYLAGVPFAHVGGCGYLYRWHEGNTVKARQAAIHEQQAKNRRRHLAALIVEWCRREGLPRLDLRAEWNAGRWHPRDPLPYGGPYGQVVADGVLEFVPPDRQVALMVAVYNKLVPTGWLSFSVPSTRGLWADMNPEFLTRFNRNSFLYYTDPALRAAAGIAVAEFQAVDVREAYPSELHRRHRMLAVRGHLCAVKGPGRHPGRPFTPPV